jgi:hypothetical protein
VASSLTDDQLGGVLQRYLTILQGHPSAGEMMNEILTEDFETGFIGGQVWTGIDGLRDFLSQRAGFFDEKHTIEKLLERGEEERDLTAETKLNFFLRSWKAPSPVSEEYSGEMPSPLAGARGRGRLASRGSDGRTLRGSERQFEAALRHPRRGAQPLTAATSS